MIPSQLAEVQMSLRPGYIEFGWGHPAAELLPIDDLRKAAFEALSNYGSLPLMYGAEQGPGICLTTLCDYINRRDRTAIRPSELFITGGISQGLDLLCSLLTKAGDIVLVQSPVYHLALRIFADHHLELQPIAS